MNFLQAPPFKRRAPDLLDNEAFENLKEVLSANPEAGDVIPGTKGRKLRVGIKGKGKRGGARVIYYHFVAHVEIILLMIYAKNERTDLRADQYKALVEIVKGWR